MTNMVRIAREISTGRQSVSYTEVFVYHNHNLKIVIKSDAYDVQSYARISRWDGTKWHKVHSIAYSCMATEIGLIYSKAPRTQELFNRDRTTLVNVAIKILTD